MTAQTKKPKTPYPIQVKSPYQVGNAIRRLRKIKKLSQTDLAQKSGLTQATISRIEKGQTIAEIETLIHILAALGAELTIVKRKKVSRNDSLEGLF